MSHPVFIDGIEIGLHTPPFIVAEMSGNHNQSIDRAMEMIEVIASTGVQALKIQTYTPDTMTLNSNSSEFKINDPKSLWNGYSLYDLYSDAHMPWEWHNAIFKKARQHGLIPFSTPFDETAVDYLESLGAPCYKIASFENTDLALIKKVALTGKPLIISTGMASVSDLGDAVKTARENGCKELILLKCTSSYPADPKNINLNTIPHLRDLFNCEVGLSDHTLGIGVSIASVAKGATFIEKHFTIDRSDGGVDSAFSMEPNEMAQLCIEAKSAWSSLGKVSYGATDSELKSLQFRRSLYITKDVKAGCIITPENIRAIRPGYGLSTKFLEIVVGKKFSKDIKAGSPLNWDLIN